MIEYKVLYYDTTRLKKCNLSCEEYIDRYIKDRIVDWVLDINDDKVTVIVFEDGLKKEKTINIKDWKDYPNVRNTLQEEWLNTTCEGFEYILNELGTNDFKLIQIKDNLYIFSKKIKDKL